jgi:putative membrane protein
MRVIEPGPPESPPDAGSTSRTGMAAERTWLAWWRTALAASAGALAVGRLAPEVLHVAPGPYIVLGCLYAGVAVALLVVGAARQRGIQRAVDDGVQAPLPFAFVAAFTLAGTVLALMTIVLVIARS